jgi:rare lipoprotein A
MIRSNAALLLVVVFLAACSDPPRGRGPADDPAPEQAAAPTEAGDDERYEFEREGEFPEPQGDVAFEEDELPPRPEDVAGTVLQGEPVQAEDVSDSLALPDPEGSGVAPAVTTPVPAQVETPVPAGGSVTTVLGFRVQLMAVAELARANTLATEAGQRLGVPVHVVAEGQHFKVRAGDFTDRADAVRMSERAKALGYDGAWVVNDEVQQPD